MIPDEMKQPNNRICIIAEAGVNHNGNYDLAIDLIEAAAQAGADYVKFQTFYTEKLVSSSAQKAAYQKRNFLGEEEGQFQMLKKLEIPEDWYSKLIQKCSEENIGFLSTAFDNKSIDFLDSLDLPLFKIPSGELTNLFYLKHIAAKGKPVILSTGMGSINEINDAVKLLCEGGITKDQITILHCNTEYPTPFKDVNLHAMKHIGDTFNVKYGYSDHTSGIEVAIAAAALGASVIEKHFTMNRQLPGPDHKASLEPNELREMIRSIRNIEEALSGSGIKEPTQSEIPNIPVARKSLHLSCDISCGEKLRIEHFEALRPGDGISAMELKHVVGKSAKRDMKQGTKILWGDIS